MSAGYKTTDGVNTHELGVTTLRGASPKAPVLTVPMATAVNPAHVTHTKIHFHTHTQIYTCRQNHSHA